MKNVRVENEKNYLILKREVHNILKSLKSELNFSIASLQINFISSEEITKINEEYLQHEGSTDIITFNYSEDTFNLDGECYICVPVAEENARKYDVSIQNELLRLIIHGILHLIGYDDQNQKDKKVMKKEENRLVNLLFKRDIRIIRI